MNDLKQIDQAEIENLKEILKRCPDGTLDALIQYREQGNTDALNVFLLGCITRHTDDEYQDLLNRGDETVSFIDDLGIDSMTMMEVVMMVEESLQLQLDNQELMKIRTVGDLNAYVKGLV